MTSVKMILEINQKLIRTLRDYTLEKFLKYLEILNVRINLKFSKKKKKISNLSKLFYLIRIKKCFDQLIKLFYLQIVCRCSQDKEHI